MTKAKELVVRCLHCHEWFPAPVRFSNSASLNLIDHVGKETLCPHCNKITKCGGENVRFRQEDEVLD